MKRKIDQHRRNDTKDSIAYLFRHYPISTPIFVTLTIVIVGLAYISQICLGYIFIVTSCLGYIYTVVRYVIIGYRIFSKKAIYRPQTGILAVIDLKLMEFFTIAGIITGMFYTDTTPGRTKFIIHPDFPASSNPFRSWAYILSVTVFVISSTGFASIVEAHLATALVFAIGVVVGRISDLVVIASVVDFLAQNARRYFKSKVKEKRKSSNKTQLHI